MGTGTFVGFGFGAIQAGLFVYEAHRSGRFSRLVVAEVLPDLVQALRRDAGRYGLNVATDRGIVRQTVSGLEVWNPLVPADRRRLIEAVSEAGEIATALPSVDCYGGGREADPAAILAAGFARRTGAGSQRRTVVYAAENDNHAAEILAKATNSVLGGRLADSVQFLNTVIGKMSGVVTGGEQLAARGLVPIASTLDRAFLVEEFNRILISRIRWPDFDRGLSVFEQKADLLPFEEAKLYGHNATHALIGFLAAQRGYATMADAGADRELMALARDAFLEESGAALCRKHAGLDPLFTPAGYDAYATDLLRRMVNPFLGDTVARVTRDPQRKLGWHDRLVGTMRLALSQGIHPRRFALGAAAAIKALLRQRGEGQPAEILTEAWKDQAPDDAERDNVSRMILEAF